MSRNYTLYQVDTYTNTALRGNPCAVVLDADTLDDSEMQSIAREMNLSETAFVLKSEVADFRARYFTPASEIPLAGHPTVATVKALIDACLIPPNDGRTIQTLTLELQVGIVSIDIDPTFWNPPIIIMQQLKPVFMRTYPPEVLRAFCLQPTDLLAGSIIQTVSTGTPQLMIPLRNREALRRARVDLDAYEHLYRQGDFFSAHLFCLRGATSSGDTSARHFCLPPDMVEDPFTGSATGAMAAYIWRYGLMQQDHFIAEQGHELHRPGMALVEIGGTADDIESIRVGGQAVTVLRGELMLP